VLRRLLAPLPSAGLGAGITSGMELGTILNTKHTFHGSAGFYPIMQNSLQHELQQQQHPQQHPQQQQYSAAAAVAAAAAAAAPPYLNGRVKSENGSERSGSPHLSEPPRYGNQQQAPQYPPMANYSHDMRYGSPTAGMGVPAPMMNGYGSNPPDHNAYGQRPLPDATSGQQQGQPGQNGSNVRMAPDNGPPKAFACSTCGKGFARRSDLARHGKIHPLFMPQYIINVHIIERIHSGIRPHVCDWPGCGKQFIQRSALTVHTRVHTGEKPHMCERCGKVILSCFSTRFFISLTCFAAF